MCHMKNDFSYCFVTRNIFSVGQSNFFSPVRGFGPSLVMSIHPMCSNSNFPVTRTIFLVRENSFLMKFGLT